MESEGFFSAKPEDFSGGYNIHSATEWLTPKKQEKDSHDYYFFNINMCKFQIQIT